MPTDELAYRLIGAVGGTIIALALVEPRTWRGLLQRAIVSLFCGVLLAEPVADYLDWSSLSPSRVLAASCLTAAGSWWIAHAVLRIIKTRSPGE
jgi:hypothetical protein